jgi:integrase/recombinase XerD
MRSEKVTRANNDSEMLLSWLTNKRSVHTQSQYTCTIQQFMAFTGKDLSEIMLEDIQDYLRAGFARSAERIASIKTTKGINY